MKTITKNLQKKSRLLGIPSSLYSAEQFFDNLSNEEKARTGYSHIMHNLSLADFLTYGVIALENNRNVVFARRLYETSLPHLENMNEKYPCLHTDLKNYLPRLQHFAKKISSMESVYQKYEQAFGGNSQ